MERAERRRPGRRTEGPRLRPLRTGPSAGVGARAGMSPRWPRELTSSRQAETQRRRHLSAPDSTFYASSCFYNGANTQSFSRVEPTSWCTLGSVTSSCCLEAGQCSTAVGPWPGAVLPGTGTLSPGPPSAVWPLAAASRRVSRCEGLPLQHPVQVPPGEAVWARLPGMGPSVPPSARDPSTLPYPCQ